MTGGCQCGAVRYEIWDAPETVYVCHCTQCRRQSASAFGISVIVRSAAFRLTGGKAASWTRRTASGANLACWFCPDCGTRLWHVDDISPEIRSVKGGSLDQPPDLSRAAHIHTDTKVPGVILPPRALTFAGEPPLD